MNSNSVRLVVSVPFYPDKMHFIHPLDKIGWNWTNWSGQKWTKWRHRIVTICHLYCKFDTNHIKICQNLFMYILIWKLEIIFAPLIKLLILKTLPSVCTIELYIQWTNTGVMRAKYLKAAKFLIFNGIICGIWHAHHIY